MPFGGSACQPLRVRILVRAARSEDTSGLVQLRLANAERHIELDPAAHRLPDAGAVRRYFQDVLAAPATGDVLMLVAEASGQVVAMAEVAMLPEPPDHQILVPRRAAQIHTVVLDGHRGKGWARRWSQRPNVPPRIAASPSSSRPSSHRTPTRWISTRGLALASTAFCYARHQAARPPTPEQH